MTNNKCFQGICNIDKQACQCNMIKLLPSGYLWDTQKIEYLTHKKLPDKTSLVNFAVFMGAAYYEIINQIVYPALRENYPHTAVETQDKWLLSLGWDYSGLETYDFTPDGLFIREIKKIDGLSKIVRNYKIDLSIHNQAIKHAILHIMYTGLHLSNNFNLERLNDLFKVLSVKLQYSPAEPKEVHCKELLPNLYFVIQEPVCLTVPLKHCGDQQKIICLDDLQKLVDIDKSFDPYAFVLDIAVKLGRMILQL